ncbi:uncharacterized protein LOC128865843 [Anastrepha ludens]|uniref:uncharacterized protein LOC128865843 n=1 Tax=Anastrepha ludens TaxID=28586 RepID=UPI0023B0BDCD|nr:uncharacterized protein LOC128865843 [Anastrepha ludens]
MLLISSAIIILISPLLMAHLSINWNPANNLSINITEIINKIQVERKIYSFFIINAHDLSQSCLCDDSLRILNAYGTVRLLQANSSCAYSPSHSNDEILLIRCLPNRFEPDSLEKMVGCLTNRRYIRILFIWNTEYKTAVIKNREELQQQQQLLFEYCAQMRLLNVISIYRDYVDDGHFYTFSYFPQFHLERKTLDEECFPDRIRDLKGFAIRTVVNEVEPWAILWRDRYGQVQIGGFLTKLLREFAKRNNGTLSYPKPVNPDQIVNIYVWRPLISNDTIDMVTGILSSDVKWAGVEVSTPLMPIDWTIMVPFPPLVPDSEVLLFLLNSVLGLFLLLLLLIFSFVLTLESLLWRRRSPTSSVRFFIWIFTNVVLRNIIGQPSCSVVHVKAKFTKRFIYICLLLSGIFMSTLIAAFLKSYITSNPHKYSRAETFDELYHLGIKIKVNHYVYDSLHFYIDPQVVEKNFLLDSISEVQRQRASLDPRFGYSVISPFWSVLSRHQSYLPRPLFYVSEQIYLRKTLPIGIPLQEHSIFMEALNNMIHQVNSGGLSDLWMREAYDDMRAAKKINMTEVEPVEFKPLYLEDLYCLWWMYGLGSDGGQIVRSLDESMQGNRQASERSVDAIANILESSNEDDDSSNGSSDNYERSDSEVSSADERDMAASNEDDAENILAVTRSTADSANIATI